MRDFQDASARFLIANHSSAAKFKMSTLLNQPLRGSITED